MTHSDCFLFDPEIADSDLDILFEYVVAETWEKSLEILDTYAERTHDYTFWSNIAKKIKSSIPKELQSIIIKMCRVGVDHLSGAIPKNGYANLKRSPKPRPSGDEEKAIKLYNEDNGQNIKVLRKVLTIDPDAFTVWLSLSNYYAQQGNKEVEERCLSRYAATLKGNLNFAHYARKHGVYHVAEIWFKKLLPYVEYWEGSLNNICVSVLTGLGQVCHKTRRYEESQEYIERALKLVKKGWRENSHLYHQLLVNKAYNLMRLGQLDDSEKTLRENISFFENCQDSKLSLADCYAALAGIETIKGHVDRSKLRLVQAIQTLGLSLDSDGRLLGPDGCPWRPDSDVPLATLNPDNYPEPTPAQLDPNGFVIADCYSRLVNLIVEDKESDDHPAVLDARKLSVAVKPFGSSQRGGALSRLGIYYRNTKRYDQAEETLRAAIKEYQTSETSKWSGFIDAKQILADVLLNKGNYTEALDLIDESLSGFKDIHDLSPQEKDISLAQCHLQRMKILAAQLPIEMLDRKQILLNEVLRGVSYLAEHIRDPKNLEDSPTFENLALALYGLGKSDELGEILVAVSQSRLEKLYRMVDIATPADVASKRNELNWSLLLLIQLVNEGFLNSDTYLPVVFGLLVETRSNIQQAQRDNARIMQRLNPENMNLIRTLSSLRSTIRAMTSSRGEDKDSNQAALLTQLQEKENELTSDLYYRIPKKLTRDNIFINDLVKWLPSEAAWVEFISLQPIEVVLEKSFEIKTIQEHSYALVMTKRDSSDSPVFLMVDLGFSKDVAISCEFINNSWLFRTKNPDPRDREIAMFKGNLTNLEIPENKALFLRKFSQIFNQTLAPLFHQLASSKIWILGLRGAFTQSSLDFFPTPEVDYAVNKHEIWCNPIPPIESNSNNTVKVLANPPLVFGGPDFSAKNVHSSNLSGDIIFFDDLPGSLKEAQCIAEKLNAKSFCGANATRARFLAVTNPSVLHVSTHGFYFKPELRQKVYQYFKDKGIIGNNLLHAKYYFQSENPYHHVGLVFSGANSWPHHLDVDQIFGGGLVFGDEILGMTLAYTDLVVLSACNSGIGLVHWGEGQLSLPRLFLGAGAKAVIGTLWNIPDEDTISFFSYFYDFALTGLSIGTALRKAKLKARTNGMPQMYWGAFVLYGNGKIRLEAGLRKNI